MNKLIFDTDGGIDDAQALLLLIANGRAPDAITTVFGNVGLDAATNNILAVLAVSGADIPVHKGAPLPLVQKIIDATHVHGEDGLGGAKRPAQIGEVAGDDAVSFIIAEIDTALAAGEKVDLIMIGPLTNLALALRRQPGIVEGIGQLTIMGGTVYGRGNTTPAAEFNIFADPEAASVVFGAGIETVMVPWEACAAHGMEGKDVDALFSSIAVNEAVTFSRAVSDRGRHVVKSYTGEDIMRFIDPLASAVLVDPSIITKSVRAAVDVALAPGITRGMTVIDPSGRLDTPKTVTVVEEARLDRLVDLYKASLTNLPIQQ